MQSTGALTALSIMSLLLSACSQVPPARERTPASSPSANAPLSSRLIEKQAVDLDNNPIPVFVSADFREPNVGRIAEWGDDRSLFELVEVTVPIRIRNESSDNMVDCRGVFRAAMMMGLLTLSSPEIDVLGISSKTAPENPVYLVERKFYFDTHAIKSKETLSPVIKSDSLFSVQADIKTLDGTPIYINNGVSADNREIVGRSSHDLEGALTVFRGVVPKKKNISVTTKMAIAIDAESLGPLGQPNLKAPGFGFQQFTCSPFKKGD